VVERKRDSSAGEDPGAAWDPERVFERFTERARLVVVLAQEEARGLKHNHIGTEHILIDRDADPQKIRDHLIKLLPPTTP
jgi:hypothetical protein